MIISRGHLFFIFICTYSAPSKSAHAVSSAYKISQTQLTMGIFGKKFLKIPVIVSALIVSFSRNIDLFFTIERYAHNFQSIKEI